MYEVKVIFDSSEETINAVKVNKNPRRITGTGVNGVTGIDSFTFEIYPNNPGYSMLFEYQTLITVYNIIEKKYEFEGRVIIIADAMNELGAVGKRVYCESKKGYLKDSKQNNRLILSADPKKLLTAIIEVHNAKLPETEKHFTVGNVDVTGTAEDVWTGYENTYNTIDELLLQKYGGYIKIRTEGEVNYIDYLNSPGEVKSTGILLAKNLISIERERDPTEVITRFIPYGNKLEKKVKLSDGSEVDSEERLTIASVNNGKIYLENSDAQTAYKTKEGSEIFDTDDAAELLKLGTAYFKSLTGARKSYMASALDLSLIGIDKDSLSAGNSYRVCNKLLNLDETLMITEKTYYIEAPEAPAFIIGDKYLDSNASAKDLKQVRKELSDLKEKSKKLTSQSNVDEVRIEKLEGEVEDLKYKAIEINSFTNNKNTAEMGSTVNEVTLSWVLNKTPEKLTIDGVEQATDITSLALTGLGITGTKAWKLEVTDERSATDDADTTLTFLNGAYYGASAIPDVYDSAFVLSLTKTLTSTWKRSINVNAGTGSYVFYCFPTRFTSSPKFTVNGFSGGFSLVSTIQFRNAYGYEEPYYIYKSNNELKGSVPIVIT